jgi:hypothetical protein
MRAAHRATATTCPLQNKEPDDGTHRAALKLSGLIPVSYLLVKTRASFGLLALFLDMFRFRRIRKFGAGRWTLSSGRWTLSVGRLLLFSSKIFSLVPSSIETQSLPSLLRCYARHFTFYIARPRALDS